MKDDDFCTVPGTRCRGPSGPSPPSAQLLLCTLSRGLSHAPLLFLCLVTPAQPALFSLPSGMRKSPNVSPRRLSDISPQLRQLKYLVVDEAIKEDLKSSRSVEDINSASIEERILRITGYYGYQPWSASYTSESVLQAALCTGVIGCFVWVCEGGKNMHVHSPH